jgi:hypothetical protein
MTGVVSCSCRLTGLALATKEASEGIGGIGVPGVSCRVAGAALAQAAIRYLAGQDSLDCDRQERYRARLT